MLILACAALTSEDFPMPRAPHNSALLAGRPSAKRSVFSIKISRMRSMPLSRNSSTRLTRGTGESRPSGCQTKASAAPKESAGLAVGALAARCAAIASNALAIRSALPSVNAGEGRFVAGRARVREAALAVVFRGFLLMHQVPDGAG